MKVSVLTTLYHSAPYIKEFYDRSLASLRKCNVSYEFVFVNDGSPDESLALAVDFATKDANVVVVDLSRNFGHGEAIMTGLQHCEGEYVFLIDCDLEEAPELFETFWSAIQDDNKLDVVYGVQMKRKGGWFERMSGRVFYRMVSMLTSVQYPADSLTARIMTRRYVAAVTQYKERELELWGVFVLSGFNQLAIPSEKGSKGSSTYTFRKKLGVAVDAVTSLSNRPLYFTFIIGLASVVFAFGNIVVILYKKFILQNQIEGWSSIVASIWLVGGLILFVLGIFGIYLSKMFNEIKGRPLSIVRKIYGRNASR